MNQELRKTKAFHTAPASGFVSVQNPMENKFGNKEGQNNECTRSRIDSADLPKCLEKCDKPQSRVPLSVIQSNNTQQNNQRREIGFAGSLESSSLSQCQNTRLYSAKQNHLRQTNITVSSGSMTQSSHSQSQSRLNCQFPSLEGSRKDKLIATSSANYQKEQVFGTGQQRQTHVPTESQGMFEPGCLQLYRATGRALNPEQMTLDKTPISLYNDQNMCNNEVRDINLLSKPNENPGNHLKRIKMDNNNEGEPTTQETETSRLAELQPKIYASDVINTPNRSDQHQLNKQNSLLNHDHSITKQIPRHTSQSVRSENKHVIPQPKDKQSQSVESRQHYQCDICMKNTTNLIDLTEHISNHIGISDFYDCSVCFKRYPKKSNLKRHYENHSEDRPSCSICMKSFPGINSLARHNITHHGIKPTCSVCRKSFTRMSSLRRHEMKQSHQRTCTAPPERPHTCSVCMKSFSAISNLKHHEELHILEDQPCERAHSASSKDPHTCSICKKVLTGISNLKRHEKIHKRTVCWCTGQIPKDGMLTHTSTCENLPTCTLCGKKFRSEHLLQKHIKNHENQSEDPSRLTCAFCSKTFTKVANTNRHQPLCKQNPVKIEKKTLEGRITVHCQECDKKFITQFPCQGPQSRAEQQLFRCDLCGISFEVLHDLIAHVTKHVVDSNKICNTCGLQTHLDKEQSNSIDANSESNDQNNDQVTNFHCVVCDEEIETKRELKIHMQYHSERVFKCSKCPKAFYSDNRLQIHMLHHTNYKQLKCLTCKMRFTQASSLERHKLIHSGRSKHMCDLCGAQFIQLYALKRHMLVHLQIKPHKCDYCGMRFRQIFMLKQHIKKFHAETVNTEDLC